MAGSLVKDDEPKFKNCLIVVGQSAEKSAVAGLFAQMLDGLIVGRGHIGQN
jgi:hypothetical protein